MNPLPGVSEEELVSNAHTAPLDKLHQSLGSSLEGLTPEEIKTRRQKYGPNELRVKQETPLYVRFLQQFKNFFAVLLIVGGLLALLAERLDPGQGNLYIATALFAVVLLNAIFTFVQEYQSEKIMDSFRKMLPTLVRVRRADTVSEIEAKELVPGDVMLLFEGDKVPADGRLLESNELKVDLSSLTGESEPVLLDCDDCQENLLESRNMVFSGSLVQSGDGEVLVCQTGMNTQIGKIVQLTKEADTVQTPIRRELQHFIKIISTIAIVLGTLFFLVSITIGKGAIGSLIFAIGIIVANVPEGLLPTVTLALTMASKRMARKNALIKNLESVETLGSTTVICTDKTGTLTQNRISVHRIVAPGKSYAFGIGDKIAGTELKHLRRIMTLCNNAHLTIGGFVGDSTEAALLACVRDIDDIEDLSECERLDEKPFTSATKYMVTVNNTPENGREAYLKGAPEVVFSFCDRMMIGEQVVELNNETKRWFSQTLNDMASLGERCLGLAYQPVDEDAAPEHGYIFMGIAGMLDPPRPEVPDALSKCHGAGIRVFMLTGDYGLTAKTIAEEIGLLSDGGRVVQGDELSTMDDETLSQVLEIKELVFARISPIQKLQIVKALQKKGEVVTVTGDGVNDSPALKNADMGVAMGIMGTDVAKEASNMVLMDDNFATIVAAVEEGRTIFDNIKKFIAYILTSNIPEILPFIAFVLLDIPLPLTVVLILAIDLGTDIVPALGLGAEKPETDVMNKPPRSRSERLLTRNLLGMSYGIVGMIQAAAGFFSYFTVLYTNGWQWGQHLAASDPVYRTAITAFFASIIICQIADVLI
ncbi:MAG: HAD-IC family P-type ATPase, partial [Arenicellales bacterium]